MASVNQTYNFNYPNMNFGQSMLYGLFGSLTGGMGMMGMGGSIFSPMGMGCYGGFGSFGGFGMGGYGMGCYSDQMVGMQIGSILVNTGVMAASNYFDGRGGKVEIKNNRINKAKNDVNTLTDEIENLKNENKGLNPPIVNGKVTTTASKLCSNEANAYTSAKKVLDEFDKKELSEFTNSTIESLKEKINKYYNSDGTIKTDSDGKPMDTSNVDTYNQLQEKLAQEQLNEKNNQRKAYENKVNSAEVDLKTAAQTILDKNNKEIKTKEAELEDAQQVIDDAVEEDRLKLNNKNAKLEAKCDALGEVDNNKTIEEQSSTQSKFNRAYEIFKNDQTQENFNKLKETYNNIDGNKASFTKLMKHIIKQHPDFDQTNIQWK